MITGRSDYSNQIKVIRIFSYLVEQENREEVAEHAKEAKI